MRTLGLLTATLLSLAPAATHAAPDVLEFIFNDGFDTPSGPITAAENTWTFIPFEESQCANGSATGIGVNLSSLSSRVFVFLTPGGACWDNTTCYVLNTAANMTSGYDAARFATDSASLNSGFFDRESAGNPFKDYSYVVVPYCTGDVHSGTNAAQYSVPTRHVGYANMTKYLQRLALTFPQAERVVLSGASAGGAGAVYNWGQAQAAFGSIRVDVIDDSGPLMPPTVVQPTAPAEQLRRTNWNLAAAVPAGCTACDSDPTALFSFYATAFPNSRGALLSYTTDTTLPSYYQISSSQFNAGLATLLTTRFDPSANLRYFLFNGSGHVLFGNPALTTNGTSLQTFVTKMVNDDQTWTSVQPP